MSLTLDQEGYGELEIDKKLTNDMRCEGQAIVKLNDHAPDKTEIQDKVSIVTASEINTKPVNTGKIVEVGRTVKLRCIYDVDEQEEITIKLVGSSMKKLPKEISLDSPLGAAINKKEIGYKGNYFVDKNQMEFEILDVE